METRASSSRSFGPGAILGIVGGALLIIGSFMTWATLTFNVDNIAQAVGVDPSAIPAGTFPGPQSLAGSSTNRGKTVIVCGVLALVFAFLLVMAMARTVSAILLMLAGLVGGGLALYTGLNGKSDVLNEANHQLDAFGLAGQAKSFFNVSIGIGVWICVIGGLVAIAAGIVSLMQKTPAVAPMAMDAPGAMSVDTPPPMSTGVPAADPSPPPAEPMSAPTPAAPEMPVAPVDPPADPPAAAPSDMPSDAGGDAPTG